MSDVPFVSNSPPPVTIMSPPPPSSSNSSVTSLLQAPDALQQQDIDPQILEALASKDRIYVLKLGEQMEALISDRTLTRQRIDLSPATSYQRMLVHRCSAYYGLAPETDSLTKAISVLTTSESRIPPRRLADLAPPPAEAPPKFKIMMRNPRSQTGSVAGDDGDISDVEASETGSLGGRSSASTSKHRRTIEERTAAYNEARNRIFIDFEEKEQKQNETTSSASSSASLVSGSSTSTSDDPGSPATESEWSGPSAAKKHPPHRANSTSSSRSLRSSAPAFMSSNSSSSRNSRAPSPAFKYPSLYEPPPQGAGGISISVPPYDPAHAHAHSAPNFQASTPPPPPQQQQQQQQMPYYPYSAHPHPHMQQPPYIAPYHHPYYPTYPYSHPPTPGSDPEVYAYNPYAWSAPAPYPPPQNGAPQNTQQNHQNTSHGDAAAQQAQAYPAYGSPRSSTYPSYDATPTTASPPNGLGGPYAASYYPHGHLAMPPYMAPPPPQSFEPRPANGRGSSVNGNANGRGRGVNGNGNGNSGGKGQGRGAPPQRAAWSYGPGVSGGTGVDFPTSGGYAPLMRDAVGPRLSGVGMGMRRGSSGARTTSGSGDDVSSVASSSTTSSSSRRTYTSTTSSQQHHPLPARPDWAVGLRPTPTLHAPRHTHDGQGHHSLSGSGGNSRAMSPIAPPRALNGSRVQDGQGAPVPPALTDFPPLTLTAPEKPRVAGAWTNSASARASVMMPAAGPVQAQGHAGGGASGSALVTHHAAAEGGPKIVRRPTTGRSEGSVSGAAVGAAAGTKEKEKERARGDAVASAILVSQVAGLTLEERASADAPAAAPTPGMLPTRDPAALAVSI
ncbi:hypothetical protein FB451DRAFT_1490090 [Mycena latifolia]|nr:hypothetical protein FB451DRAFT_1490090 [Mycena latifolia]